MNIAKARKVLQAYKENGLNASKALPTVGYAQTTSTKHSGKVINRAVKAIAEEDLRNIATSSNPVASLFDIVKVSSEDVLSEYVKILRQDKDLSTKLKSMLPLLKELGLTWEQEQTNVKVPILNITTRGTEVIDNSSTKPLDTQ